MIKKHIKRGMMAALLIACLAGTGYAASSEPVSLVINGEQQSYEKAPVKANGTVFVPMRDIFETLGATVEWSSETKQIEAVKGEDCVRIKVGSENAFVNNKVKEFSAAPYIDAGTTMVPVRFVSEALGATVTWDNASQAVNIDTKQESENVLPTDNVAGILSYEDAMKRAIRQSSQYNAALADNERVQEQNDSLTYTSGSYNLAQLQAKKGLNLKEKWAEMQLPIIGDSVGNNVKNLMDTLNLSLQEQALAEDNVKFLEYKLQIAKLKHDVGFSSKVEMQGIETDLAKKKSELILLQQDIEAQWIKLNSALGYSAEQRYELEYTSDYAPIGEVDLDRTIKDNIGSDPYLWLAKENTALEEFMLLTYEYNVGGQSYSMTKLDLSEAKRSLAEMQDNLGTTIRTRYNTLMTLEENIAALETNLDAAKRSVGVLWLQYDLGMATKAELEEAQLNIPTLELAIYKLETQHQQYKVLFERPYLMPEYASAS